MTTLTAKLSALCAGILLLSSCVMQSGQPPIGGERDEHGCLIPAGYAYDADIQACVRSWELNEDQKRAARIAADSVGAKEGLIVIEVRNDGCEGCFTVRFDRNEERFEVTLRDWRIVQPEEQKQTISLYFYSESDLQNAFFEHPIIVRRTIPASENALDTALRLLFAGPSEEEKENGARTSSDLTRLGPLYLGVRKDGDAAVVNFKQKALEILNSAAARQFMAKEPIRKTLLQFPGIKDVKYAIDGEIFEEWDA